MDRAVSLHLFPESSSREDYDQDKEGSDRGGHRYCPQLAEEIWVSSTIPDGMRESPLPTQMGSVTMPAQQGHALPHRHGDSPVDSMEAEWCALLDQGFLDTAIERSSLPPVTPLARCTMADGKA